MAEWEYKFVIGEARTVEKELNEFAGEEWEPVNMSALTAGVVVLVRRPTRFAAAESEVKPVPK